MLRVDLLHLLNVTIISSRGLAFQVLFGASISIVLIRKEGSGLWDMLVGEVESRLPWLKTVLLPG
jgi:hypothetical protein